MFISFNKPFLTGKEAHCMYQAVYSMKLSGNGMFTNKCQQFFEEKHELQKTMINVLRNGCGGDGFIDVLYYLKAE